MKPKLRKVGGLWECASEGCPPWMVGCAETIGEAYARFVHWIGLDPDTV